MLLISTVILNCTCFLKVTADSKDVFDDNSIESPSQLWPDLDSIARASEDQLTRGFTDAVSELYNKIVDYATTAMNELVSKTEEMFKNLIAVVNDLMKYAEEVLIDYVTDEIKEVEDLINQNKTRKLPCVIDIPLKLNKIKNNALANLKECVGNVMKRIKIMQKNVLEHVGTITKTIAELNKIATKCSKLEGVTGPVKCFLVSIPEVGGKIMKIVSQVPILISETSREVFSLHNDTRGCILDILRQARNEMKQVIKTVPNCILG